MYHNILVPISFDTERDAQGAVKVAQKLLADGGTIRLLHVIEAIPDYVASQMPQDVFAAASAKRTRELEAMAADIQGGVATVMHGHSGRSIIDFAQTHDSDLVVIASHRPGMQNLLLGSTATHVVRHVKCAVHVLR